MRLPHLVDIVRAPLVAGAYGSQTSSWATATTTVDVAAYVQPQSSSEQVADAERVTTRWRIFLGPTADLVATDRVVWNGTTFEVDGDVETHHRAPGGGVHHLEALLSKVTGG